MRQDLYANVLNTHEAGTDRFWGVSERNIRFAIQGGHKKRAGQGTVLGGTHIPGDASPYLNWTIGYHLYNGNTRINF